MKSKKILITLGDYNGIGPVVVQNALNDPKIKKMDISLIGDRSIINKLKINNNKIDFIYRSNKVVFNPGKPTIHSGRASLDYLHHSIELIKSGKASKLVTGPISKEAIQKSGSRFKGHTDLLQSAFSINNVIMAFWSKKIKVSLSTIHIPLDQVIGSITSDLLLKQLEIIDSFFVRTLGHKPKIGLCGINPHASENGTIGNHDLKITVPAVKKAKKKKINVSGPYPSDTLFVRDNLKNFDVFHAIYHDQGLIPFKMLSFDTGVNFTINLPFVRTSPDHGTAYDIAWKKNPNPNSMIESIKLADSLNF